MRKVVNPAKARHVALPRDAITDGSAVETHFWRQSRPVLRCEAEPLGEQRKQLKRITTLRSSTPKHYRGARRIAQEGRDTRLNLDPAGYKNPPGLVTSSIKVQLSCARAVGF